MPNKQLVQEAQIVDWIGSGPVDADTDRTFDYLNCENYRRAMVILSHAAGTAGDDFNLTIRQASDATGTGVKDADIVDTIYTKQAATNLLSTGQFTKTTQTADALVSGNATSAEQVGLVVIDLDLSKLDTNNGFNFIGGTLTLDASGGAQQALVLIILYDARYPQDIAPSVLA